MKAFLLMFLGTLTLTSHIIAQEVRWPRQITNEGSVLTLHQPQIESWEDNKKLDYRMAFSLQPAQGQEVLGVLYLLSASDVNMEEHTVLINDISIQKVHFPSLDEDNAAKMEKIVRSFLTPDRSLLMSLEQVVACTPKKDSVNTVAVNNDPPVIFTSKRPTILLQLEGEPVKAAASKEKIEFVINANFPLFFDTPNSTYYLYDGLEWQKGKQVSGPWSFTSNLPATLVNLVKDSNWSSLKSFIPAVTKADKKIPQIFYSEKVAELILFEGEPAYKSISGTSLKYATNTESDIFFSSSDKQYYYITSGRWFKSSSLNGPWTFATYKLPADFSKIPQSSPAAVILPFVPGTDAAKDAVMIAQIPTTIEVNATEAAKQVQIIYSGEPEFKPIDSTTLFYAVNTADKVIKVSSNQFYACVKGIWFVSATAKGPWQTATSVPEVIYAMPASSPVYNVTYVTQTITTTNTVQATYTSGYTGVYVMAAPMGVIIVSGTGYYHPPYYYYPPYGFPIFYPYPVTYGMYAYHPYHYGGVAYHASYNPHTGMYARSATAYGPYGSRTVAQGYNPSTGTYARGASVSTPYGSRTAASAYNPYTGASAATRQGSSPYAQWGTSAISKNGQTIRTGHITTDNGSAKFVKGANGDMYAGGNGNIYKNTGNGWEQANHPQPKAGTTPSQLPAGANRNTATQNNAGTNNVGSTQRPTNSGASATTQNLNRDYQNRQRGNTQTQQYRSGSTGASSMQRGGGTRSGGRRR